MSESKRNDSRAEADEAARSADASEERSPDAEQSAAASAKEPAATGEEAAAEPCEYGAAEASKDAATEEPSEEAAAGASEEAARPPKSRLRSLLIWGARGVGGGAILFVVLVAAVYLWHARDLPGFDTLADYQPLQSTRLVTTEGEQVGELFIERRTVVPFDEMPELLWMAFIAAEDERFYEHEGLDYMGIARALIRNLQAGGVREGASTITQQVVKTFLLTPERRYSRKFKEMILARRLEQNLTKDEILYLYLNQIYFGHGRYGVQEAARYYFAKDVGELELHEVAVLAALPRAPNLYSPRRHPRRAQARRAYVLRRMVEAGMVDEEKARLAGEEPIELAPLPPRRIGSMYVEEVRRMLETRLGSELLLGGGLTVEVAMDPAMQRAAEEAMADNLRAIDKRQGWRGPLTHLDAEAARTVEERHHHLVSIRESRGLPGPHLLDLSGISQWDREEEGPPPVMLATMEQDRVLAGRVQEVEAAWAKVDLGGALARLELSEMRWARPFGPEERTAPPRRVSDVLSEGDVVFVRLGEMPEIDMAGEEKDAGGAGDDGGGERPVLPATLEQHPLVEGALVAIDPRDRGIVAMVGGYDMARSHFNRATQARRQPGSAFKPFVYGAAMESGKYTAASVVLDAPEMFRDRWTGDTWRPRNYDGRFDGDMTFRSSLAVSKNLVAVRLADDVGVDAIIDFSRRAGIGSRLPRFLPLALGSGEVTPLELVNAYATIAALGTLDEPTLVLSVEDGEGKEIFRHVPAPEEAFAPEVAYVLTDLMTSVLTEGTGRSLNRLGRPTAGKTGTTDDRRDAWFVGYTPELVAGAWIGFDEPQPLGRSEYGGRAAGPAWLGFMERALDGAPIRAFEVPPGVQFVRIDPDEGLLAPPGHKGVYEPFLPGTAPAREAESDALSPIDFLLAEP